MYELLGTLHSAEFRREFDNLRTDIELILDLEGYIIALNEYGERYFQEESRYFYDYLEDEEKERAFGYISQLTSSGTDLDVTLSHHFGEEYENIHYRGKQVDGYILLNGRPLLPEPVFSEDISALMPHFEHACAIMDSHLNVIQYNHTFEEYMDDDITNSQNMLLLANREDGMACIPRLVQDVLRKKTNLQLEVKNDQSGEHLRLKGIYLKNSGCVLFMLYDLSIEKKYTRLLTYQDQMESVSYLAAGVAHELRNPLSVIKGFLQLSSLTDSFHKYSDTILSETNRMNEIIDNFLSVARKKTKKELRSPKYLLNSVIDIIKSECLMQDIHFDYRVKPVSKKLEVNESSFKQIVLNVLRNSIEAFSSENKKHTFSLNSY
ncbi:histidine kinase dimerization/phospho-acceptor domain-containing protein [Alteribacillus iranensis]|uniref:histidine kinase n=1 Tax=Alteribacillus iranensis TaxID=930128 RepID=A0A1I1ZCF0_9BACI|nr:histidine kinase dimerization/phospho-acceptor domain-containing protein [Alteribacillus iranensis]SFE29431.1 His Kinase A (phospho-acceptor) domain-containing protein [Alteribacillus iranensis]